MLVALINRLPGLGCLLLALASGTIAAALPSDYEVEGNIRQTIIARDNGQHELTNEFKVQVRGGGWFIEIMETDGRGNVVRREIGSTNGDEIYELVMQDESGKPSGSRDIAVIDSDNIPVGRTDDSVIGHLWLMFASQRYFDNLTTNTLRPVYDWQASASMRPYERKQAKWELLGGSGSLPRDVKYLGQWGETNAHYAVIGTNFAGETAVPGGFIFEEYRISPDTVDAHMLLRKRVIAEVTAVRDGCSRAVLLPLPERSTMVFDQLLARNWAALREEPSLRVFNYLNPVPGKWPSIGEALQIYEERKQ